MLKLISKSSSWPRGKPASPQISATSLALLLHASFCALVSISAARVLVSVQRQSQALSVVITKTSIQTTVAKMCTLKVLRREVY